MAEGTIESVAQNGYAGYAPAKYDNGVEMIAASGVCDLREEAAHTRADIRESIQNLQNHNAAAFAHVHEKACDAEKEAIKARYDVKLQVIQTGKEGENRTTDAERRLSTQTADFERSTADRFCSVEKLILTEGCTTRELVRDQGERTREKLEECCCELKEKLSAIERRSLEVELAEAKESVADVKFAALQTGLVNLAAAVELLKTGK